MSAKVANKGVAWLYNEVCALLDIWADQEIQQQLSGRLHNMCIYERISRKLRDLGITRSGEQCREKIKKLRRDYKTIIDNNYSPAFARKVLGCYDKVHEIFGKRTIRKPPHVIESIIYNENFGKVKGSSDIIAREAPKIKSGTNVHEDYQDIKHGGSSECDPSDFLTNNFKNFTGFSHDFNTKRTQHNMNKLNKKCTKELMENQSSSLEKIRTRQIALHNRFLAFERKRFSNELSRQQEKLLAIETQRRQEREQKIKLFKMILNAMVAKHGCIVSHHTLKNK